MPCKSFLVKRNNQLGTFYVRFFCRHQFSFVHILPLNQEHQFSRRIWGAQNLFRCVAQLEPIATTLFIVVVVFIVTVVLFLAVRFFAVFGRFWALFGLNRFVIAIILSFGCRWFLFQWWALSKIFFSLEIEWSYVDDGFYWSDWLYGIVLITPEWDNFMPVFCDRNLKNNTVSYFTLHHSMKWHMSVSMKILFLMADEM